MPVLSFPRLVLALGPMMLVLPAITQQTNTPAAGSRQGSAMAVDAERIPAPKRAVLDEYGRLPLSFEANQGQTSAKVKFLSHGSGYGLYLTAQEAVLTLHAPHREPSAGQMDVLKMQLQHANSAAGATGVDILPGVANYLIGDDPSRWKTSVPTYSKVRFSQVYPGVDLVYYGNQGRLEYDFVVAPGANPQAIRLHFSGATKLALTGAGDLAVSGNHGQIAFHKPVIYQEENGRCQIVSGQFALLADHSVRFSIGRYDRTLPLIVDPFLLYSTYFGGSGKDSATGIAVDRSGDAYVVGSTTSTDFPLTGKALQVKKNGPAANPNVFITKLNPSGTALLYSTYLGGSGLVSPQFGTYGDGAAGIALDSAGDAYVTGKTFSSDFPVTPGAFQTTYRGQSTIYNVLGSPFVAKLNPTGTTLLYSTFLSGSDDGLEGDAANAIAVDANGYAYVGGVAYSDNFPVTAGAYQTTSHAFGGTNGNGFVTKLNPTGSALVYSTYLGGHQGYDPDVVQAIAIDSAGDAFVAGLAFSLDFPTTPGAFQPVSLGYPNDSPVGFVTKLNPTGTGLIASTLLGGSGNYMANGDAVNALAIDQAGDVYVTGIAESPDFPVSPGAFQTTNACTPGCYTGNFVDGFVAKLNPAFTTLDYSTFLGGSAGAAGSGISVDSTGAAYVVGSTNSLDYPVTSDAYQATGDNAGKGFVSKLNPTGSALLYSTYLGGSGGDSISGIVTDVSDHAYVAGTTHSTDLPVTPGALQASNKSASTNAFVAKLDLSEHATRATRITVTVNPTLVTLYTSTNVTFTAKVSALAGGTPTGDVTFIYPDISSATSTASATVPLDADGVATFTTTVDYIKAGTSPVGALYAGTAVFDADSITVNQAVAPYPPTFSPPPAKYVGSVSVSLNEPISGTTIRYTLDGSTPTASSPVFGSPIQLPVGYTLVKAASFLSGVSSMVSVGGYTVTPQTPAPTFSPGSGDFTSGRLISIVDPTPGATIRYTTDGSTPTTKSNLYTGPISLTRSVTLRAIAISTGDTASPVSAANYTVR